MNKNQAVDEWAGRIFESILKGDILLFKKVKQTPQEEHVKTANLSQNDATDCMRVVKTSAKTDDSAKC